jgi:hypothetical protein
MVLYPPLVRQSFPPYLNPKVPGIHAINTWKWKFVQVGLSITIWRQKVHYFLIGRVGRLLLGDGGEGTLLSGVRSKLLIAEWGRTTVYTAYRTACIMNRKRTRLNASKLGVRKLRAGLIIFWYTSKKKAKVNLPPVLNYEGVSGSGGTAPRILWPRH